MKVSFSLLLLALPLVAEAKPDLCYVTANAISVEVSSDRAGPLLINDAGDGENEQGKDTCADYLAAFRVAYTSARGQAESLRQAGACSAVSDTVGFPAVIAAAMAHPSRMVLGSEFPLGCR